MGDVLAAVYQQAPIRIQAYMDGPLHKRLHLQFEGKSVQMMVGRHLSSVDLHMPDTKPEKDMRKALYAKARSILATEATREKEVKAREKEAKTAIREEGKEICGACGGLYATRGGRMVLHGYQRPGLGYTLGECPGVGLRPWTESPEGTKRQGSIPWYRMLVRTWQPGLPSPLLSRAQPEPQDYMDKPEGLNG